MTRVTIANLPDINEIEELNSDESKSICGGTSITIDAPGNFLFYDFNPLKLVNFVVGFPGKINSNPTPVTPAR